MAEIEKYQFDVEFGEAGQVVSAPIVRKKFSYDEVEQLKAEAYAAGESSASAQAAEAAAAALAHIAAHAQNVVQHLDQATLRLKTHAFTLAQTSAQKIAGHALEHYGNDEIEALLTECLSALPDTPRLTISIAENLHDELAARIQTLAEEHHFAGRIVTQADAAMPMGDCRIEWPNGGLERDHATIAAEIDEIVARRLHAEAAEIGQLDLFDTPTTQMAADTLPSHTKETDI